MGVLINLLCYNTNPPDIKDTRQTEIQAGLKKIFGINFLLEAPINTSPGLNWEDIKKKEKLEIYHRKYLEEYFQPIVNFVIKNLYYARVCDITGLIVDAKGFKKLLIKRFFSYYDKKTMKSLKNILAGGQDISKLIKPILTNNIQIYSIIKDLNTNLNTLIDLIKKNQTFIKALTYDTEQKQRILDKIKSVRTKQKAKKEAEDDKKKTQIQKENIEAMIYFEKKLLENLKIDRLPVEKDTEIKKDPVNIARNQDGAEWKEIIKLHLIKELIANIPKYQYSKYDPNGPKIIPERLYDTLPVGLISWATVANEALIKFINEVGKALPNDLGPGQINDAILKLHKNNISKYKFENAISNNNPNYSTIFINQNSTHSTTASTPSAPHATPDFNAHSIPASPDFNAHSQQVNFYSGGGVYKNKKEFLSLFPGAIAKAELEIENQLNEYYRLKYNTQNEWTLNITTQ